MEDWGDISYNESILLYDPAKSSSDTKQWIFEVIAHEVAHQWFGDLVTAASWDEIWLNEAFATWMSNKTTARFNPDWQIPLTSILWRQKVMRSDAGPATRAIRSGRSSRPRCSTSSTVLPTPRAARVLDDARDLHRARSVSARAQCVFRRPRSSPTPPPATCGITWRRRRGTDVGAIAQSWTDQPGYPLLQAQISCNAGKQTLALEQRRFSTDGAVDATSLWKIPVTAAAAPERRSIRLLTDREATFSVRTLRRGAPVRSIRPQASFGFNIRRNTCAASARARLRVATVCASGPAYRYFCAGAGGTAPLTDVFRVGEPSAAGEGLRDDGPFSAGGICAAGAGQHAGRKPCTNATCASTRARSWAPMLRQLGWNPALGEGAVALGLRNDLIDALGRFDDPQTLRKSARTLQSGATRRPGDRPLSIRPSGDGQRCAQGRCRRTRNWSRRLIAADRVEDRRLYASALANVEDPKLARRLLWPCPSRHTAARKSRRRCQAGSPRSPAHGEMAYAFTRENFDALSAQKNRNGVEPGCCPMRLGDSTMRRTPGPC